MITNKLMDARAPTIIIDTWDAIEYLDKEALASNIRVSTPGVGGPLLN